jgi:hypothetical protein
VRIAFVMNPTSWCAETDAPWPGGMADLLVQPIIEHLDPAEYDVVRWPQPNSVNVYYTHRSVQGVNHDPPGSVSVFVSHGIADKDWRSASRLRNQWDWVFVSGPAWSAKLAGGRFPLERVCEVGYTKIDPVYPLQRSPAPDGRIRVLWAPTHGGGGEAHINGPEPIGRHKRTSHWRGAELLALLDPDRFDVTVALHPRHRPDKRATLDEYRSCDVVIADGGSTIYEAWALGLPAVFPAWITRDANVQRPLRAWTFEADIYAHQIDYHAGRPDRFAATIERAVAAGITREAVEFVEQILPARYRGRSGELHAEALRAIAGRRSVAGYRPNPPAAVRYRNRSGVEMVAEWGSLTHRRFEASHRWTRVTEEV